MQSRAFLEDWGFVIGVSSVAVAGLVWNILMSSKVELPPIQTGWVSATDRFKIVVDSLKPEPQPEQVTGQPYNPNTNPGSNSIWQIPGLPKVEIGPTRTIQIHPIQEAPTYWAPDSQGQIQIYSAPPCGLLGYHNVETNTCEFNGASYPYRPYEQY